MGLLPFSRWAWLMRTLVSWLFCCKEGMQSYASKLVDALQGGVTWAAYYFTRCCFDRTVADLGANLRCCCRNYLNFKSFMVLCGTHIIPWWTFGQPTQPARTSRCWCELGCSRAAENFWSKLPGVGPLLLQLYLAEGLVPEFVASISRQN